MNKKSLNRLVRQIVAVKDLLADLTNEDAIFKGHRISLCRHAENFKDLEGVLKEIIKYCPTQGRRHGSKSVKTTNREQLIVREAKTYWKVNRKRPGVSTDPITGKINGPFVRHVMDAALKQGLRLNEMQIKQTMRQLKKELEIIAMGLFKDYYDNRSPQEIYAHFLNQKRRN